MKMDAQVEKENDQIKDIGATEDVFDRADLLNRLMGDEELADEIINDFILDVPNNISALKEALKKNDAYSLQQRAHTLKGASGNVSAVALQEIARRIELAGETEDFAKAGPLIAELDEQLEKLKKNLGVGPSINGDNSSLAP